MLVVHGVFATAVVRDGTGEPVVLLSGELPEALTPSSLNDLMNLAAAVLDTGELDLFYTCLAALRCGEKLEERRIWVDGAVLTIYRS
ncbi:hypothetical protein ACWCQN_47325 [Streptomyces sp. NPDC001984]